MGPRGTKGTLHWQLICNSDRGGVKKSENVADVIYGSPPKEDVPSLTLRMILKDTPCVTHLRRGRSCRSSPRPWLRPPAAPPGAGPAGRWARGPPPAGSCQSDCHIETFEYIQSWPKKNDLGCVISPLCQQAESGNHGHTFFAHLCTGNDLTSWRILLSNSQAGPGRKSTQPMPGG